MAPVYKLVLVPLDSADSKSSPIGFDVNVVSVLEFSAGSVAPDAVTAAVNAHPILNLPVSSRIRAYALSYSAWRVNKPTLNGLVTGAVPVTMTLVGDQSLADKRSNLLSYLTRTQSIPVAKLVHDKRFDNLTNDDFLNIAEVHDDLTSLRNELLNRAVRAFSFREHFSLSMAPEKFSEERARWITSYAQTQLLTALFGNPGSQPLLTAQANTSLTRLKRAIPKIEKRLTKVPPKRGLTDKLQTSTDQGEVDVSPLDPNVAVHAALKNDVLAANCGFVTRWHASASQSIDGDYVIAIDLSQLTLDATVAGMSTQPTVFRRRTHTHPLSFADVGSAETSNGGLAFLNDASGSPRYRASAIHTETHIIQTTLLQQTNSIANVLGTVAKEGEDYLGPRDNRPPALLAKEQFGVNEPESGGITISAPTVDLMTPGPLKDPQRPNLGPCLFLEDLWVGFRLDLAPEGTEKFWSIHHQNQEVTFASSKKVVRGQSEDFFAREQPGDPTANITSTELGRYIGLSVAQVPDYMKFLGKYEPSVNPLEPPFTVKVTGYSSVTPLRFGHVYPYRLRNVFLGGISFSDQDRGLVSFGSSYIQVCPFYRARAFKPGEVIDRSEESDSPQNGVRTVYLSKENPRASLWVVPCPLDTDTARYHGLFLTNQNEPARNSHRYFVTDLTRFFTAHSLDAQYYVDPDVSEIVVTLTLFNGDPHSQQHEFTFKDGAFYELIQHLTLPSVNARFGKSGQWEKFRPIQISFATTSNLYPSLSVNSGQKRVNVTVPAGAELELTLTPVVSNEELRKTATYASSTDQLRQARATKADDANLPFPGLVQHKIRAIHCVKQPAIAPFVGSEPTVSTGEGKVIPIASRERLKETAQLGGYLQVDAATTGQVRIEASWSDIEDNAKSRKYILNAATANSKTRSITFSQYKVPAASTVARVDASTSTALISAGKLSLTEQFELQSAENKIFLELKDNTPLSCAVDFVDTRRKQAKVRAVAIGRYPNQFKSDKPDAFERRSDWWPIDVPASMKMVAASISHIIPLSRDLIEGEPARQTRVYAMRIFVYRPWFLSGPGERLAIGCRAGRFNEGPSASLNKYLSQWGEDPVERPKLPITKRLPRASDFRIPDMSIEVALDSKLYSAHSVEGNAAVLYRDNVVRVQNSPEPDNDILSLASFALRWHEETKLWYCDVEIGQNFVGWCGMALYRHQPNAHEGLQISESPAWAYGAILHGESVAWTERQGMLHITVGPVFDRYTTFELDATKYNDGVSANLHDGSGQRAAMQKYVVQGKTYFEGVVRADNEWSLVKLRFGSDVSSKRIQGA
ncbi:hypothetical protein [Bradyrhizobium sp. 27S5]|uniref:hypothetical protein n=1 Tax=Bradyrhizobium sp. 27S5 TaxID=3139728 RepID=UPI0030CC1753